MILLDGNATSKIVRDKIKDKVDIIRSKGEFLPGLAVIIVGDHVASKTYVRNKVKACNEVGIVSKVISLKVDVITEDILGIVQDLNRDTRISGILVQLPMPSHIDPVRIMMEMSPMKDVDGFHPVNVGRLSMGMLEDAFVSCTPLGIIEILSHYRIAIDKKHVVVVGRSNIVGKPVASLLMQKDKSLNATVTVCHSGTSDIARYTKQADILIAATGKPDWIKKNMIKEGAVLVDVGINRVHDTLSKKGYRLVGDIDFRDVVSHCSAITPVPGGIGPMTIAMLLSNTIKAYELNRKR